MDLNKTNIIMKSSEIDICNNEHDISNNLTLANQSDSVIENNIENNIVNGENAMDISKKEPTILHTLQRSRVFDNSNNNINSITLEFFANNGLYSKYLHKTTVENSISQSDKKFYKRRVYHRNQSI